MSSDEYIQKLTELKTVPMSVESYKSIHDTLKQHGEKATEVALELGMAVYKTYLPQYMSQPNSPDNHENAVTTSIQNLTKQYLKLLEHPLMQNDDIRTQVCNSLNLQLSEQSFNEVITNQVENHLKKLIQ